MTPAAKRIKARWQNPEASQRLGRQFRNTSNLNAPDTLSSGNVTYSGSSVTNTSSDFLGDWRSADAWMRFDMLRVRMRSRQIERGNPWGRSFAFALQNNVVGSRGFRMYPEIVTGSAFGDASEGVVDERAIFEIRRARKEFEKAENFTVRKKQHAIDVDKMLITRLAFDGEVIIRKIRRFNNDFGFSWQIIDPDYLDHNLNRIEPNGNFTKMGVELDKDFKFPVAYWFFHRRPNDYYYNYMQHWDNVHYRVPVEEIIHFFVQTDDSEQTRGWPWLFAACVNLHRMGKFEEASLVNAVIGSSKMGFFKKTIPTGFAGNPEELDDDGAIIDEVSPGSWQELPWNVEPVQWDSKYPNEEFDVFSQAMLRSISASLGTSYMTLTGDVTKANFSNLRAGQSNEREHYMGLQEFFVRSWKEPEHDEFIYRGLMTGAINLPFAKYDKFKHARFVGRRWPYVNPQDDLTAKKLAISIGTESVSNIIREVSAHEPEEVFRQIAADKEMFKKLGIADIYEAVVEMPKASDIKGGSDESENTNTGKKKEGTNPDKGSQHRD